MHLKAIENHEIDGSRKFTLGTKHIYTVDWAQLPTAERIFITEGIIDYLSIKTLEGDNWMGFALMGNQPVFDPGLLPNCHHIIAAFDNDPGGAIAYAKLQALHPEKRFSIYSLFGYNDPNDLLMASIVMQHYAPF